MCRYVWIIGPIVIKIPRIYLTNIFWYFPKNIIIEGVVQGKLSDRLFRVDIWGRFKKYYGLNGFMENIRELKCYLVTRHKLLTPLYFSLIVLNIYKREKGIGNVDLDRFMLKIEDSKYEKDKEWIKRFRKCAHTFECDDNFAYNGKVVRIIDYGEEGIQNLLIRYGDQVEELLLSVAKPLE